MKLLLIKGLHGEDFFLSCNNFEDLKNVFYMLSFMSRHKRLLKIEKWCARVLGAWKIVESRIKRFFKR